MLCPKQLLHWSPTSMEWNGSWSFVFVVFRVEIIKPEHLKCTSWNAGLPVSVGCGEHGEQLFAHAFGAPGMLPLVQGSLSESLGGARTTLRATRLALEVVNASGSPPDDAEPQCGRSLARALGCGACTSPTMPQGAPPPVALSQLPVLSISCLMDGWSAQVLPAL